MDTHVFMRYSCITSEGTCLCLYICVCGNIVTWLDVFELISAGLMSVSFFINHRGMLPIPSAYEGAVLPVFSHLLHDHIS